MPLNWHNRGWNLDPLVPQIAAAILLLTSFITLTLLASSAPLGVMVSKETIRGDLTETIGPGSVTPTYMSTLQPTPSTAPPIEYVPQGGITIGLKPLTLNDRAIASELEGAIRSALVSSVLTSAVAFYEIDLSDGAVPSAFTLPQSYPGIDLLVAWKSVSGRMLSFYLAVPSEPPLLAVDGSLETGPPSGPGATPIHVLPGDGLDYPAALAVSVLEIKGGLAEQALERLRYLQVSAADPFPDAASERTAVVQYMIGLAEEQRGNLPTALQSYSQALRLNSTFAAAYLGRGNIYQALGDKDAALADYELALVLEPNAVVPAYNLALVRLATGDSEAALAEAQRLTGVFPSVAWSHNLVGLIHYRRGEYTQALNAFERANALQGNVPVLVFNLARTLHALGDYRQALATYDLLLDLDPNNPVYHLYMGLTYQAQGRYPPAEHAFNRAIDLDPAYLDAYLLRAQLHLLNGELDDAIDDAHEALTIDPEAGAAYVIIGDVRLAQEDFSAAEAAYSQALDRGVTTPEVYAARGWAWHRQGYREAAIRDYEAALAEGLTEPLVFYRLGLVLLDVGRYDEALSALLGAVNGGHDDAETHVALAVALEATQHHEEAEQEFRRALALNSNYGDVDFLTQQSLWSQSTIQRAQAILRRLGG